LPKQKSGLRARLYCPGTSNKGGVHGTGRIPQQRIDQENAALAFPKSIDKYYCQNLIGRIPEANKFTLLFKELFVKKGIY